jgi:hypothetical protein
LENHFFRLLWHFSDRYVCLCIYIYKCIYIYICNCMYMLICICMYVWCMYMYMYIYLLWLVTVQGLENHFFRLSWHLSDRYVCLCIYICIYIYAIVCICVSVYVYMYVYVYMCMYIYTYYDWSPCKDWRIISLDCYDISLIGKYIYIH